MNFLMVNCSWVSNFFFGKEERESVIFVLHFLFCIIIVSMSLLFFFFGFTGSSLLRATFSSCSQRGLLLQLWCAGVSLWTCGLNSCVTQAWLPHGMQDPPGPRIKPMYPALASGFLTPGPPGMSTLLYFYLLDSSNSHAKFPTLALVSVMVKPDFVRVLLYISCYCSIWCTGTHSLYL